MLSKILILSFVVGVCIAATASLEKPKAQQPAASEDLKTAESSARQFGGGFGFGVPYFGFGGYGGYGHNQGGFGGYGGYGGGHNHNHGGGYGGYGHGHYPHGGGYGHHHG